MHCTRLPSVCPLPPFTLTHSCSPKSVSPGQKQLRCHDFTLCSPPQYRLLGTHLPDKAGPPFFRHSSAKMVCFSGRDGIGYSVRNPDIPYKFSSVTMAMMTHRIRNRPFACTPLASPCFRLSLSYSEPSTVQMHWGLHSFARLLCDQGPRTAWLNQQTFLLSQFWRLQA